MQFFMNDFRPDPSSGKYKSEHKMFNDALKNLLQGDKLFDPNIVKPVLTLKKYAEYVIRGAAVAPAARREEVHLEAQNAMPEEHQYPPIQPAAEPTLLKKVGKQLLLEPI